MPGVSRQRAHAPDRLQHAERAEQLPQLLPAVLRVQRRREALQRRRRAPAERAEHGVDGVQRAVRRGRHQDVRDQVDGERHAHDGEVERGRVVAARRRRRCRPRGIHCRVGARGGRGEIRGRGKWFVGLDRQVNRRSLRLAKVDCDCENCE